MSTTVQLAEQTRPYQKALTTNADSSSFASKVPTIAEPTNDGVVDLAKGFFWSPIELLILPYGLGSDNDVFDMKVIGWRHIGAVTPSTQVLWVPTTICEFTCTISAAVGVAGSPVLNTERFADTIVVKSNALQPKYTDADATPATTTRGVTLIYSPADDTIGWILLRLMGFEKIEFTFDQTTGTPTANCLIAKL